MKILKTRREFQKWRSSRNLATSSIGFVPTMGALHRGHAALIERARRENDFVVVSIFVNPTQFGPNEDFKKYPRQEKADLKLLHSLDVDAVFLPNSPNEIYPREGDCSCVEPGLISKVLEGKFRPGHFRGVATVVNKLFQIVRPTRAYFGEKDFQQVQVIQQMVEDLFLPVEIVRCQTIREKSGLALSSRNQYLSHAAKQKAAELYQTLKTAKSPSSARKRLADLGFKVQYVECWDDRLEKKIRGPRGRWLAAVFLDGVRLIDNLWRNH